MYLESRDKIYFFAIEIHVVDLTRNDQTLVLIYLWGRFPNLGRYTLAIARSERPRELKHEVFRIGLKICASTNFGSLIPNMWLVFAYVSWVALYLEIDLR